MDSEIGSQLSLRDFLHLVFKRRIQILLFFAATVITVAAGTLLATPTYEAKSQILVKIGRENLYLPTVPANTNQSPVISINREEQINSEIEILTSPALLEKMAAVLGPTRIYDDMENGNGWLKAILGKIAWGRQKEPLSPLQEAVLRLQKDLSVEAIKKSNVIEIALKHPDPQMAATALNQLVDLYMERHLEVHKTPQSYKFFQEQSQILQDKLRQAEARLETFKKEHQVSSLDEERSLLLSQEASLRADFNRTLSQLAETENRTALIQQHLTATPKSVPTEEEVEHSPYVINTLQASLVGLELKEKDLLTKYTEQSRLVENVRDEIKIVQAKLIEQEARQYGRSRSGLNTTYQHLQEDLYRNKAELKAVKAKEESQDSQLAEYRGKLVQLNRIEVELKGLQRQVDVEQQNYKLYLTKFEESRISDAMDSEKIANVAQIQPAQAPLKPVSPKVLLNLILGVFLGAFGSLGLAFFMEYLDDSIEKPEDAEDSLHLPVLASVPVLKASTFVLQRHRASMTKV
jgi:polysaccharide biosynthesis protein PslE